MAGWRASAVPDRASALDEAATWGSTLRGFAACSRFLFCQTLSKREINGFLVCSPQVGLEQAMAVGGGAKDLSPKLGPLQIQHGYPARACQAEGRPSIPTPGHCATVGLGQRMDYPAASATSVRICARLQHAEIASPGRARLVPCSAGAACAGGGALRVQAGLRLRSSNMTRKTTPCSAASARPGLRMIPASAAWT